MATLAASAACSGGSTQSEPSSPDSVIVDGTDQPEPAEPGATTTVPAVAQAPAGVNWTRSEPFVGSESAPLPTFDEVAATAGVPPAPPGFPFRQSTYLVERWDVGGQTFVSGGCSCWEGGDDSGVFGGLRTPQYLFRTTDGGATWSQVDLSAALGTGNGYVEDITEAGGALLLTASIADASVTAPSVIIIARSTDGAVWERVVTVAGEVGQSLLGRTIEQVGGNLVLVGADIVCDFRGSYALQAVATVTQTRVWTSADGGVTWTPQARADTALDAPQPPDAAGCDGLGLDEQFEDFELRPRAITALDGAAMFVWSADGTALASTTDGVTWTTAELDGAVPTSAGDEPTANSIGAAVLSTADGFVALNVEQARTSDDAQSYSSAGFSVVGWTGRDDGSWERQPLGRPLAWGVGSTPEARIIADGDRFGLQLRSVGADAPDEQWWSSESGLLEDWATCVAAAGANCAFAESIEVEPGADLTGIDLTGVILDGVDLTDVSLRNAVFEESAISNSILDGTDFSGARLRYTSLSGDVSGARFDGTTFDVVYVDGGLFAADLDTAQLVALRISLDVVPLPAGTTFAGMDLTGWSFTGLSAVGDLTGVDFSSANLTGTSFEGVDLTGARFDGADIAGIRFFTFGDIPITCPDGLPIDATLFGPAACRLPLG